jgi:hypothetical protein
LLEGVERLLTQLAGIANKQFPAIPGTGPLALP